MELQELLDLRKTLDAHEFVPLGTLTFDPEDQEPEENFVFKWVNKTQVTIFNQPVSSTLGFDVNGAGLRIIGKLSNALDELIKLKQPA